MLQILLIELYCVILKTNLEVPVVNTQPVWMFAYRCILTGMCVHTCVHVYRIVLNKHAGRGARKQTLSLVQI